MDGRLMCSLGNQLFGDQALAQQIAAELRERYDLKD
jgi:Ni,Fe-hydrogenase maturation factor